MAKVATVAPQQQIQREVVGFKSLLQTAIDSSNYPVSDYAIGPDGKYVQCEMEDGRSVRVYAKSFDAVLALDEDEELIGINKDASIFKTAKGNFVACEKGAGADY